MIYLHPILCAASVIYLVALVKGWSHGSYPSNMVWVTVTFFIITITMVLHWLWHAFKLDNLNEAESRAALKEGREAIVINGAPNYLSGWIFIVCLLVGGPLIFDYLFLFIDFIDW